MVQVDLPVEGVAVILAIDPFMDTDRLVTNVLRNAITAFVITQWKGEPASPAPALPEDIRIARPSMGRA